MSLKAKIEAVIYAAEEPVTLAQLATIFADEALAANAVSALSFESGPHDSDNRDPLDPSGIAEATDAWVPQVSILRPGMQQPESGDEPALAVPQQDAEAKKMARARDREARSAIQKIVDELVAEYASGERGMEIREIAGGYRISTKAEYHDAVRLFVKGQKPQMKLSLQALETLAVVAYKQPVTAPEISEIRGVDTSGVLGGLMARKLITTAGRKQVIGRPILYKTTREFLLRFGLKDVSELPSIEEFEKMAVQMAADMAEADGREESPTPEVDSVEDSEFTTDSATEENSPEIKPGTIL